MTPTIVARNGKPLFAVGSPGGKTIINTTMQVILNVIDHEFNIAELLRLEEFTINGCPTSPVLNQYLSADTLNSYRDRGHQIETRFPECRYGGLLRS